MTVEEPSPEEAYEILKGLRPYYEKHHGVRIEDTALEASDKKIPAVILTIASFLIKLLNDGG